MFAGSPIDIPCVSGFGYYRICVIRYSAGRRDVPLTLLPVFLHRQREFLRSAQRFPERNFPRETNRGLFHTDLPRGRYRNSKRISPGDLIYREPLSPLFISNLRSDDNDNRAGHLVVSFMTLNNSLSADREIIVLITSHSRFVSSIGIFIAV